MRAFFYDTWAFVALANKADPHHALAVELDRELEKQGYVAATSDYVIDEAITLLHLSGGARAALALLDVIEARTAASELLLLEIHAERRARAVEIFRKLAAEEPRLSFTDCTSFGAMRELGIQLAFTADRHFHRAGAGIRPLLERRGARLLSNLPAT